MTALEWNAGYHPERDRRISRRQNRFAEFRAAVPIKPFFEAAYQTCFLTFASVFRRSVSDPFPCLSCHPCLTFYLPESSPRLALVNSQAELEGSPQRPWTIRRQDSGLINSHARDWAQRRMKMG